MDDNFSILVVEDDANDVMLLKRALNKNQISNPVQVLADGAEAIAYLTGFSDPANRCDRPFPRFILLDLKMPRRSGFEVLEWMHGSPIFRSIPKIILTSSSHKSDVERAYGLGATSYLVKPANFDDLQKMIKTVCDYWSACLPTNGTGSPTGDPVNPVNLVGALT